MTDSRSSAPLRLLRALVARRPWWLPLDNPTPPSHDLDLEAIRTVGVQLAEAQCTHVRRDRCGCRRRWTARAFVVAAALADAGWTVQP